MKPILVKYGFAAYLLVVVIQLAAIVFSLEEIRFASKLLLMPLLWLAVYSAAAAGKERTIMLAAIFFSFLGDGFLLFDYINPLYFIVGLVSFLLTHILYIIYFLGIRSAAPSPLKQYPLIVVAIIAYGCGLVYFLFPKLGELKIPVIVYAVIICSMLLASIHVYRKTSPGTGMLYVVGALLFVVSDSLLAINKFNAAFPAASFLIMLTYCLAQYCIARGFVKASGLKQLSAR